jgi:acetyl esterase/lipase
LIAIIAGAACYKGQKNFPPADHSVYDVPYASGYPGDESLALDVHFPDRAMDLPVIVYIHGGGWVEGDKSQMDVWSKQMSRRGYVVFNVNYRLAPEYPFPVAINDCLGALAWIVEHAPDYGGDPDRIGVTGGSAGGHLTAMVATAAGSDCWKPTGHEQASLAGAVKAQVPFFGVFDFNEKDLIRFSGLNKKFLGGGPDEVPENYLLASPVNFIGPHAPPTLLVCGKLDPIYNQSNLYYRALKNAGAPVEYAFYPFQTHGFDSYMLNRASRDAFEKMMEFFDEHL